MTTQRNRLIFGANACAAGWEKGQVGDVRGRLFVPSPRGRSYAEINEWLMDRW